MSPSVNDPPENMRARAGSEGRGNVRRRAATLAFVCVANRGLKATANSKASLRDAFD